MRDLTKIKIYSICGQDYTGWGNNAQPINDGRCCDGCNGLVIHRRIVDLGRAEAGSPVIGFNPTEKE